MKRASMVGVALAALVGASAAYAADMKHEPSSVSESRPDMTGKKPKGKAGEATMPGKGPSSVSESAPDKANKDKRAPLQRDSKDMPNPKSPTSVNESKPSQPHK